jgi:hypothetical protein
MEKKSRKSIMPARSFNYNKVKAETSEYKKNLNYFFFRFLYFIRLEFTYSFGPYEDISRTFFALIFAFIFALIYIILVFFLIVTMYIIHNYVFSLVYLFLFLICYHLICLFIIYYNGKQAFFLQNSVVS